MPDKLEGFALLTKQIEGLYGEVVVNDVYRLKMLDFMPTVVLDIGANIGLFTRRARELFGQASIISVEPNPFNFEVLRSVTLSLPGWGPQHFLNMAIGQAPFYFVTESPSFGGYSYLSACEAFPAELLSAKGTVQGDTKGILLSELAQAHVKENDKLLLKIDIEGGDGAIFFHEPSIEVLKRADYLCMELHRYGMTVDHVKVISNRTDRVIGELRKTHDVELEHTMLYARRRA
jgi:FkbM family methyltransferase